MSNTIANHAADTGHLPNWNDASILAYEEQTTGRNNLKYIHINQQNSINLDGGIDLIQCGILEILISIIMIFYFFVIVFSKF